MKNSRNDKDSKSKPPKKIHLGFYYFLIFALFFGIAVYLATTRYFMIEDIYVAGNNKYPNEQIIASSGIKKGENLFKMNARKICKTLKNKYEYIQDVKINVMFPTSVIIDITQAEPFALLKDGDEFLLISEEGRVLERSATVVNTKMPIVIGMGKNDSYKSAQNTENDEKPQQEGFSGESSSVSSSQDSSVSSESVSAESNFQSENDNKAESEADESESQPVSQETQADSAVIKPGDYISKESNETFRMLISLIDAFEKTEFIDVTRIDITDRLNMKIVYQDRLLIELGSEDNLEYKLNFVKQTAEYKDEVYFEGVIDATIPKQLRVREMSIDGLLGGADIHPDEYQIPEVNQSDTYK